LCTGVPSKNLRASSTTPRNSGDRKVCNSAFTEFMLVYVLLCDLHVYRCACERGVQVRMVWFYLVCAKWHDSRDDDLDLYLLAQSYSGYYSRFQDLNRKGQPRRNCSTFWSLDKAAVLCYSSLQVIPILMSAPVTTFEIIFSHHNQCRWVNNSGRRAYLATNSLAGTVAGSPSSGEPAQSVLKMEPTVTDTVSSARRAMQFTPWTMPSLAGTWAARKRMILPSREITKMSSVSPTTTAPVR
jgi:hypothetical protein